MQCVFHSIRFKVNKVGIQRYPIFFALLSSRKRPPRKTLTSTKQTIYLWRNSHTPPPNHPKEERERNTRCANMQRRPEAKHCSSLCLQSEGTKIGVAKHGLKFQQSHGPERWPCSLRVRGPHFASKVSYNAGAATDDCASQQQISAARTLPPNLILSGF